MYAIIIGQKDSIRRDILKYPWLQSLLHA